MFVTSTGLRQSEALGLCWDSVDMETGKYEVRRKITRDRNTAKYKLVDVLKTESASRIGILPPAAMAALRHRRVEQAQQRLTAGVLWEDNDLVFPDNIGRPLNPENVIARIARKEKSLNLPRVGMHGLRHLLATSLIRQRVDDATIAAQLGHSSAAFTRKQYADVYEDSAHIASAASETLLAQIASKVRQGK